jgi:hypothetical protein
VRGRSGKLSERGGGEAADHTRGTSYLSSSFLLHKMTTSYFLLLLAIAFSAVCADYVQSTIYLSTCGGTIKAKMFQYTRPCDRISSNSWGTMVCSSGSSGVLNTYNNAQCAGASIGSSPMSYPSTCTSSSPVSISCVTGTYTGVGATGGVTATFYTGYVFKLLVMTLFYQLLFLPLIPFYTPTTAQTRVQLQPRVFRRFTGTILMSAMMLVGLSL